MSALHQPVMTEQVLEYLDSPENACIVDATVGAGGHAYCILEKNPRIKLIGLDRDEEVLHEAASHLEKFGDRVQLIKSDFANMASAVDSAGWKEVGAVLMDVGVSSPQIDKPERGFSYRQDGPLDMRMDRTQRLTAARILNRYSEKALTDIFRNYGEERKASKIARAIVERRENAPWRRTGELSALLTRILHRSKKDKTPVQARCFQALRIAVNDELQQLEDVFDTAISLLQRGGRLLVISFHSLEDRIVKHTFRNEALNCVCPADFPECRCDKEQRLTVLTKKPVTPPQEEVKENSRASGAKLRVAERV